MLKHATMPGDTGTWQAGIQLQGYLKTIQIHVNLYGEFFD
jgi:hypothetical protein